MLRRLPRVAGWIAFLTILVPIAKGQDHQLVGRFSDLSRTEIHGARSFTVAEIREGLMLNSSCFWASHPVAPLDKLPGVISRELTSGYLSAGYADVDVQTELDFKNTRLISTIVEGPKYFNGVVRIENAQLIDVHWLNKRLTEPFLSPEAVTPVFEDAKSKKATSWLDKDGEKVETWGPIWRKGKPANFDDFSRNFYHYLIIQALEESGFFEAHFDVNVEPNRKTKLADLIVRFREEGRPAKIEVIRVQGNERNSADAIAEFLNLTVGMNMTRRRLTQIQHDLWRCDRFISSEVELVPPFDDDGHALLINVSESPYSPPISQALSEEEQTLVKMGQWLGNPDAWPGDLVLRLQIEDYKLDAVMAPKDGVILSLHSEELDVLQGITFVISHDEASIYPVGSKVHLRAPAPDIRPKMSLGIKLKDKKEEFGEPEEEEDDGPFLRSLRFEILGNDKKDSSSPISVETSLNPVTCIALANTYNAKTNWAGDRLILDSDKAHIEIDRRDGRLLNFYENTSDIKIEFFFSEGGFAKRLNEEHQSALNSRNVFDAQRPLQSTFSFIAREEFIDRLIRFAKLKPEEILSQRERELLPDWASLISKVVLDPADELWSQPRKKSGKSRLNFFIQSPIPIKDKLTGREVDLLGTTSYLGVETADQLFPRDSWAWTIWRETGFFLSEQSKYLGRQLEQLYQSEEVGPVANLVIACLLARANQDSSQLFLQRARESLSLEKFRKDYRPLLENDLFSGQYLRCGSEILRTLNDRESELLATRLQGRWKPIFIEFSRELRRDRERPIGKAMPAALDVAWKAGLKKLLEDSIEELLQRNDTSTDAP